MSSAGSEVAGIGVVGILSSGCVLYGTFVRLGCGVGSSASVPGLAVGDGPIVWVGVLERSASAVASFKGASVLRGKGAIMIFVAGNGVLGGLSVGILFTGVGVLDGANSFVAGVLFRGVREGRSSMREGAGVLLVGVLVGTGVGFS